MVGYNVLHKQSATYYVPLFYILNVEGKYNRLLLFSLPHARVSHLFDIAFDVFT